MSGEATVHATCVAIGETGVLIRGPSGAGKTALARRLIAEAARRGCFARLVADDRVRLAARNGRIVARPHPAIAGQMELRGAGLLAVAHEPASRLGLVVDLGAAAERMPEPDRLFADLLGARLPRVAGAAPERVLPLVLHRLGLAGDCAPGKPRCPPGRNGAESADWTPLQQAASRTT